MGLLITWGNVAFFLISSMALGLLHQLQIFSLWYLLELPGLVTGLGLLELWYLIYPTLALDISKPFDRVWHAGLLQKLRSWGISGQIFGLMSSFVSSGQLLVVLDGKSSQEYLVSAGVPQGSILDPTLFLLYINVVPDGVICGIGIYADNATLYSVLFWV